MTRSVLLVTATLISASVSFGFGYYDSMTSGTPIPGISPVSVALGASKAIGISFPVHESCHDRGITLRFTGDLFRHFMV